MVWVAGYKVNWLFALVGSRGEKKTISIKTFKSHHGSLIQSGAKLLHRCGGYGQLQADMCQEPNYHFL